MKLLRKELVQKLKSHGTFFSEFSLVHEGRYSREDGDWNYKDRSHVDHVHKLVRPIWSAPGSDICTSVLLQNILGLRFTLTVADYQAAPWTHTYHTSLFFFVLIAESTYEESAPNFTKVTTTYSIGSSGILRWCHFLLRWVLKRNYENLMSGDIPMRLRRGELRSLGYSFRKDSNAAYTFTETLDILKDNVICPDHFECPKLPDLALEKDLHEGKEKLLGKDDHYGLRLVRSQGHLSVFPRLCPHEGARLDQSVCENGRVKCPWHGRVFTPIASFDLKKNGKQKATTNFHEITYENGIMRVRPLESSGKQP